MRLTSQDRLFLVLFALIVLLIFYTLTSVYAEPPIFELHEVTVKEGDSLWSISRDYHKALGLSIQDYIYKLREINQLDSVTIYPGQSIQIPVPQVPLSS